MGEVVNSDFQLGPWLVEPSLNTISRNGTTVHLEPKLMGVLVCLANHPAEVIPKETLLETVWPDTFVSDDVLKHAISELRRVFGDKAREPSFIQTIAKRGYRLVAPVNTVNGIGDSVCEEQPASAARNSMTPLSIRSWRIGMFAIAGTALLSLLFMALHESRGHARSAGPTGLPPIRSIAVLPLQNLSADPAQEYFSEGITDGLITDLTQIESVRVISRTSSMQYKQATKTLPEIAHALNVDGIVEGTVQRSGNRVRISAQLIDGRSDKYLWAASYERDTRDVFTLERDLTQEIAHQIQSRLTTSHQVPIPRPRPVDPNVLELYLQGNYHLEQFSRGSGDEEKRKAAEYFQQAIDADPQFAPAYVGVSYSHYGSIQSLTEDVQIEKDAAERAVELDPTLSEGWLRLAEVKFDSWDWQGAEQGYRRAIALNPNNPSAHKGLCSLLDATGRMDIGLQECEIAQQLDPKVDHVSYALFKRHEYDRAIAVLRMMLRNDPKNGYLHHKLYENYAATAMYKEAMQHLEQTATLFGFREVASDLQRTFASSGYIGAMRQYAKDLERFHATGQVFLPVNLAVVYAQLGDNDRAFYWLNEAYKHRGHIGAGIGLTEIKVYPLLDSLHRDPRFSDLVRRLGLTP